MTTVPIQTTQDPAAFTIDRQTLSTLLVTVSRFAGKKPPYDLVDLVFERGRLFASCFNGEAGIKAIVAAQSNIAETQKLIFGVHAELLSQLVATLDGTIKISMQEAKVLVQSGNAKSRFNAVLGASLPAIEAANMQVIATLTGSSLLSLLRALDFASSDPARPALNSLLIELDKEGSQIHAWTADGFVAAHISVRADTIGEGCSLLLPNETLMITKIAAMVSAQDSIQFMAALDKSRVAFGIKEAKARKAMLISLPVLANTFPLEAVKKIFAARDEAFSAGINSKSLALCVRQMQVMETSTVHLFAMDRELHIESAGDLGAARNVVKADAMRGELDLHANSLYLGKLASVDDRLNFTCSGPASPLYFSTAEFQAVLMPILVESKNQDAKEPVPQETQAVPA